MIITFEPSNNTRISRWPLLIYFYLVYTLYLSPLFLAPLPTRLVTIFILSFIPPFSISHLIRNTWDTATANLASYWPCAPTASSFYLFIVSIPNGGKLILYCLIGYCIVITFVANVYIACYSVDPANWINFRFLI